MKAGWIQLHKSLFDWEWYDDANTMRLFIHCCLRANFKDNNWKGNKVSRGSFITSVFTLSSELKLSESKIRLSIKKLKSTNEITIKTTNKFTVINVCNYDTYNSKESQNNEQDNKQDNNQTTNKEQTNNNQTTTDEKDNNTKKKEVNKKHTDFCDSYLNALNKVADEEFIPTRPKNTRVTKEWIDSIRLLEKSYDWDEILATVRYYFAVGIKKDSYRIEAFSVKSFRSKYDNIAADKLKYDKENEYRGPENR